MFAFERDGVIPDILTLSKTLGAGLPLGATITSSEIEEVCNKRGFFYYTTHLNDPLVCAVGSKVCEIVTRDDMPAQARHKGAILKKGLYDVSVPDVGPKLMGSFNASTPVSAMYEEEVSCWVSRSSSMPKRHPLINWVQRFRPDAWRMDCLAMWYS
jgi:glutamate-1-semialdehyde aminotransferase